MKKIITICLVVILVLGTMSVSFADETVSLSNKKIVVLSEYDMYKEFKSKTDDELEKCGYTEEQIVTLREKDYLKELTKRSKFTEKTLKELGYTEDQIKVFKNFKGTDEEIQTLSANLTFSLQDLGHEASDNFTYCDIYIAWNWSQCPVWIETDIVAVVWSDSMYCNTSDTDNTHVYYYWYDREDNTYESYSTGDIIAELNTGAYTKQDIGPMGTDDYLKMGGMALRVHKQALVTEFAILAKYGHTQLALSPSVTLAKEPSLSISFSWYVAEVGIKDLYVDLDD